MTDETIPVTAKSPDVLKREKILKVKIFDWKKKGYDVSRFTQLIEKDISIAENEFDEFVTTVKQMEAMEGKLYTLDTSGFEQNVERIEAMLKNPALIEDLEREFIVLEENILRRKLETAKAENPENEELNLKREMDRIREEELKRIREEESGRIKEQERKKILTHELGRIREEERERLRQTELERIRKEEKERLVWENRVIRQLRQAKETTGKKNMKCPSCKSTIEITSTKRPLKIRCSGCGKDYTLKSKSGDSNSGSDEQKIQYKKCPKCNSPIPIVSDKRPLKIICQMCNSEYLLKGKSGEADANSGRSGTKTSRRTAFTKGDRSSALETKDYGSSEIKEGGKSILCPTCTKEIPAEANICGYCGSPVEKDEVSKAQNQQCPSCGKDIPGDARICGYCGTPINLSESKSPMDDLELPSNPNDDFMNSFDNRAAFKPLSDYSLPQDPDLSGPGVAPAGSIAKFNQPDDGVTCPKCGNIVPRGAKFCGTCGNVM